MPLQSGSYLKNRYRIESVLGQGGMGAVYEAFDVNLGMKVAVKENLFTTDEFARQFRREATILASLRHPNLPRVTDHFVIEGEGQYLVMDFIEGMDLRDKLEQGGPVLEDEAVPWFLAIADALAYLHSRKPPILHRDIKPGNIKVMSGGRAMLVDFGLAKVAEEGGTTSTGAKAMTPGFSPPEQYGTGRTDPRTDVYSLGATMYAALTAAIPEDSIQRAMGREKLTPVRKRNPDVSSGAAKVIEKALAVHPEDRYQSVREMANALRSVAGAAQPTVVRSYPYLERTKVTPVQGLERDLVTRRLKKSSRLRRLPSLILIALTIVLVAVGARIVVPDLIPKLASLFSPQTTEPSLPGAVETNTPEAFPSPTSEFVLFPASPSPEVSVEPTAAPLPIGTETVMLVPLDTPQGGGVGQIAYVSEKNGVPQIYLINVDGTGERQLTFTNDGACQPAWSPNGMQLVFTSPCQGNVEEYPGSGLWLISFDAQDNVSDPEPVPTGPGGGGGDYDPAWAPDGERIAFTSRRDGRPQIYLINVDGTGLINLNDDLAFNRQPAWSPDGTRLAFTSSRGGIREIWIMPAYGGEEAQFAFGEGAEDTYADWSGDGELILFQRREGSFPYLVKVQFKEERYESRLCQSGKVSGYPMAEPDWSPDGKWIVFETWPDGKNHNIGIVTLSCTEFTQLTENVTRDYDPAWRPLP
ncbi:MAG TPA: protein kinase [Anaerolineae bacterium]|nr:protein kinase [Anaerolineae bacterium]